MITVVQPSRTDEELIRSAVAGSGEALAALYRRYATVVYRVAYRLLPEAADAEDVLQDVFVGLPEALQRFEPARPLEPWLKRVTACTAISRIRSNDRRDQRGRQAVTDRGDATGSREGSLERIAVRHALDRLPEPLRAVILLKEVEGYSHEEIGAMLGISAASSATRLHRAWKRLRKELER